MTRSRITEQKEKSGVVLKVGTTEIECKDNNQALEEFRKMDASQAEIISADGNSYSVQRG